MTHHGATDHDRDASEQDLAATTDACVALAEEIEILEEQVALLEEGLPGAPGAQRAALAKEINEYRELLDSRRRALHLRCAEPG